MSETDSLNDVMDALGEVPKRGDTVEVFVPCDTPEDANWYAGTVVSGAENNGHFAVDCGLQVGHIYRHTEDDRRYWRWPQVEKP